MNLTNSIEDLVWIVWNRAKHTRKKIIEATLSGFSLSNSFGYMIWDWLAVYGGGQFSYLFAKYKMNDNEKKTTDKIDDHLWGYGPFFGTQLNTTGPYWRVVFCNSR